MGFWAIKSSSALPCTSFYASLGSVYKNEEAFSRSSDIDVGFSNRGSFG